MAGSRLEEFLRQWEADPASPVFVELARELLAAGQAQRAADVCRQGLEHHPDDAAGQITYGRALLRLGKPNEARACFEAALSRHPQDPEVHAAVGEALLERGLFRSAGQLIRKGLTLAPDHDRLRDLLARVEGAQGTRPPAIPAHRPDPLPPPAPRPEPTAPHPVEVVRFEGRPAAATHPHGVPAEAMAARESPARPLPPPPPEPTPVERPAAAEEALPDPEKTRVEEVFVAPEKTPPPAPRADDPWTVPPLPSQGKTAPPPVRRGPRRDELEELLGSLPEPAPEEKAPVPADTSAVVEEAASVAAAYERELRERLAAEQAQPPSWMRRHRLGIALGLLVAVGGGAGAATYHYRRAATLAQDVARYTAAARNGLLRDTRAAYKASLTALDEVLDRDESHPNARALEALALAQLAVRFGDPAADRGKAARLLGKAEQAAEPEVFLATRYLLAEDAGRRAVEDQILAVDASRAGATLHSLAGEILLRRGEPARAIERFNAAIAAAPGHVPTLVRVAEHYRERKEWSEALRYHQLALAVAEDHPVALIGAAEALLALGRSDSTLQEALTALSRLEPAAVPVAERHRLPLVRARLLAALDRRKEALAELEPLIPEAAESPVVLPALSDALVNVGAPDRAVDLFRVDSIRASTPAAVREAYARALLAREQFRAVTLVPAGDEDRNLHLLQGRAWLQLGAHGKARAALRKTATRQAGKMPADAVVFLGLADLRDGEVEKARRNLERLGTGQRARTAGRTAWAELLVGEGQIAEAEAVLREAVALDRDTVEARCALGRLLLMRGAWDEARDALEAAIARNPFHAEARAALGAASLESGALEEARRHLSAAIEQAPEDGFTLATLARLAIRTDDQQEAERRLGQAARRAPRAAATLLARAELALARREPAKALAHLEEATKRAPRDPSIWARLGDLRLATGAADKAAVAWARAARIDSASLAPVVGEAQALAAAGKVKHAVERLEARLSALGENGRAEDRAALLAALAEVELQRDPARARSHAEQAVVLAPERADVHLALGRVLEVAGDRSGAETHLRRAYSLGGERPSILRALGLWLLSSGNRAEGEKLLRRFLERAPDGPAVAAVRQALGEGT